MGKFREMLSQAWSKERGAGFEPHEKKLGKNVAVNFSFTRHGIPEKDPETKMSLDKITAAGLAEAKKSGQEEIAEYILVTGSKGYPEPKINKPVTRARQSGEAYIEGVSENGLSEVINNFGEKAYASMHGDTKTPALEFGVYALSDLNLDVDAQKTSKPIMGEGLELVEKKKMPKEQLESWVMNEYLKREDPAIIHRGATEMAHRLMSGIKMSGRLFEGLDVKVNNFTHTPKTEMFLQRVLIVDGKTGFSDLSAIGGNIKPNESINFKIERDEQGELKPIVVTLRGQEYQIDMHKLAELNDEYNYLKKARQEEAKEKLEK